VTREKIEYITPARREKFVELWPTDMHRSRILEILDALPGPHPLPNRLLKDWGVKFHVKRPVTTRGYAGKAAHFTRRARTMEFAVRSLAGEDLGLENDRGNWTSERLRTLVRLWNEHIPADEMGVRMGTTKNTILGKIHRLTELGLVKARPHRGGRPRTTEPRPIPVLRAPTLPRVVPTKKPFAMTPKPPAPKPVAIVKPPKPKEPPVIALGTYTRLYRPAPAPVRLSTAALQTGRGCQWPMWPDKGPITHIYCDALATRGSYCAAHGRRAYARDGVQEEAA
jgi:hypothetical protein